MYPMSINSIYILHTSWMIPREVDPVETNPYKKLFYLSFDPSVNDDAATILSFFCEMKKTLKIHLPPSSPAPFRSICLHLNQRPSPAHLPVFFFILFLLLLHPPPPCLCRLRKWGQLVVITTSIFNNKFKFRQWIKRNNGDLLDF
jgi:hypothetical protein